MPKQLAVLERAGYAESGDGARGQAADIAAAEANAALAAIVEEKTLVTMLV